MPRHRGFDVFRTPADIYRFRRLKRKPFAGISPNKRFGEDMGKMTGLEAYGDKACRVIDAFQERR